MMRTVVLSAILWTGATATSGVAQSLPAREWPAYAADLEKADSTYGESHLALSSDGRWLAIASDQAVTVVRTTGGAPIHLPLPPSVTCGTIGRKPAVGWDARARTLALTCSSLDTHLRLLFTWRRGESAVHTIDSALVLPAQWLPDGRRLVYLVMVPAASSAASVASPPPRSEPTARTDCLPATIDAVAVLCSDSVDVLRSKALERRFTTLPDSRSDSDERTTRVRLEPARFDVVVTDLSTGARTVLTRLTGEPVDVMTRPSDTRIAVVVTDSAVITGAEVKEANSVHFIDIPAAGGGGSARSVGSVDSVLREPPRLRQSMRVWSPDGTMLAWWAYWLGSDTASVDTLYVGAVAAGGGRTGTEVISRGDQAKTGEAEPPPLYGGDRGSPVWTPDGTRVLVATEGRLWMTSRAGGRARLLSENIDRGIWGLVAATDHRALVTTLDRSTGRTGLWSVDLASGRWHRAMEAARSAPGFITAVRHGSTTTLAYLATTLTSPSNVYLARVRESDGAIVDSKQLTHAKAVHPLPAIQDTVFTYAVDLGVTGSAVLVRPADAKGPLPTIVWAYPGGHAAALFANRFGVLSFVDAFTAVARGYAVLFADVPMPPEGTYGEQGPIAMIVDGMTAVVAAAGGSGWVDTTRLGVIGHSYGGYMVNALVTSLPNRFRAAVSLSGMSDLVSAVNGGMSYGREMWFVGGQGRLNATLDQRPDRYIENSPTFRIEHVTTPLLLIHGVNDHIGSIRQSEEMFQGLAQLERPVELVRDHGAEHSIRPSWWPRALDWFDTFLQAGGTTDGR